jgi:hypothetical protein
MMDPIDDQRSELQRAGEVVRDVMRPELQNLRREIVEDIKAELRRANLPKIRRPDPRKQAIASLIQQDPDISTLQICRAMDKRQEKSPELAPLPSWNWRLWQDAYHQVPDLVHVYISAIRRERN